MQTDHMQTDKARRETDALIEAIWGPQAVEPPPPDDATRRAQNRALAAALTAYLDQYLAETPFGEG